MSSLHDTDADPKAVVRFCRDCRWGHVSAIDRILFPVRHWEFGRCGHPSAANGDYFASGLDGGRYCSGEREYGQCGRTGKHWEARS